MEYGRKPKKLTTDALKTLESFDWPGNIRELKNVLERLVIMSHSDTITPRDIITISSVRNDYFTMKTLKEARESFEKDFILKKLEENNWNISKTAETLDMERSNLHRKIKAYDIRTP